ncbi:hypothetical protein GIB67_021653 [Kingdonia uniflora]|uniref:Protein kinase domain-containing protein n=1 Tax=Kingdonia uniflora TaxID=39325 RepID=A0A7J7KY50_9MAGN|nr:hypothetical protein GIB67_021653 [Kingdonia uniflora]
MSLLLSLKHGIFCCCVRLTFPGEATGFCRLSKLKMTDFSYNFLVGRIHTSLPGKSSKCNVPEVCGDRIWLLTTYVFPGSEHGESVSRHHQGRSKPAWLLALEIVTGTVAGFLLLFAILAASRKCKGESPVIIPWKKGASNGNDQMIIHIDSIVYKGTGKDGPEVAVISLCIKEENWTGYLELYFQRVVADLARSIHENAENYWAIVENACCRYKWKTQQLVFEYASNGTLYGHLHFSEGCHLSWTRRMQIIIGIARGLKYLHIELESPLMISELNSCSVYLTDDFSPKVLFEPIFRS